MNIKTFDETELIDGFNKYESTILKANNISDVKKSLPDLNKKFTIETYLEEMEPIDRGDEFVDFINKNKHKKYCVIGDYDCDGIMATVIMTYGLILSGCDTTYTIPDRFEDGYGMHKRQVDIAKQNGAEVIVTVDNGITANETIDYAHSLGLTVIVTDHHTPQGVCNGDIVIDPFYNNDKFKMISGATVAMKLIYKLYRFEYPVDHPPSPFISTFACMAYFTVFSDVMPMLGENRIMVDVCTKEVNEDIYRSKSFIRRLSEMIDFYVPGKKSDPYLELDSFRGFNKDNIDFYFVPVINACNRVLGNVNDLVFDIMCLFVSDYKGIPHMYSGINKKRKYMKTDLVRKHIPDENSNAIVEALVPDMWDDNYSGIVGLVASTVVEKEHKPALIGIDNPDENIVHFSGRSVSGFNLYEALSEIKTEHPELSLEFGGHAEALGAKCTKEDLPKLKQFLSDKFSNNTDNLSEIVYYKINNLDVDEIFNTFRHLLPFGNKFEFPKFYVESCISYLDKDNRTFSLKSLGHSTKIKYFDRATQEKLTHFAFKERDKKIKLILSVMQDDNNDPIFKLDQFVEEEKNVHD